jgi:SLOG family YspA-like protein
MYPSFESRLYEHIAVVGNRKGADMRQVVEFIDALHRAQPDTILISGGAAGVDQMAESSWFRLGGRIRSYRPAPYDDGFGVEVWNYGGGQHATAFVIPVEEQRLQLASYASACIYRDTLIAEDCDRLVAFYRRGIVDSSGIAFTEAWAREREADVHVFVAKAEVAA